MANKNNSFENQHDQSNLYQKKKKNSNQTIIIFYFSLIFADKFKCRTRTSLVAKLSSFNFSSKFVNFNLLNLGVVIDWSWLDILFSVAFILRAVVVAKILASSIFFFFSDVDIIPVIQEIFF